MRIIVIIIFLITSINLYSESYFVIPDIVVKSSKLTSSNNRSPYTKVVIDVDKHKYEEKTLGELLETTPGVHVTTLAGRGSYTTISIRGSTSSQVLVYIDGVLVNSGGESTVDLSTIPLQDIKKIEIYRGNIPPEFGRAGIGGVINIITKKKSSKINSKITYGSFKFYSIENNFNIDYKNFNNFLNISGEVRTGDYPYYNDANTPFNTSDDYHAHRRNNYYNQKSVLYNVRKEFNSSIIDFNYKHFYKHRELPGVAPGRDKPWTDTDASLNRIRNEFNLSYSYYFKDIISGIQLYWTRERKFFKNPNLALGMYGLFKSDYYSRKKGFNYSFEWDRNNFLNFKFYLTKNFENLKIDLTPNTAYLLDSSYSRSETDLTFANTFYLFKKSLIIEPVYRKNRIIDKNKRLGIKTHLNKGSKSIGIKYFLPFLKKLNIYAKFNYGKFYRFPNFYEKFGDGATLLPNQTLRPEYSRNKDYGIGFNYNFNKYPFNISGDLTFFKNKVKDLIEFIMVNERYSKYKNIENAEIKGYELMLNFNFHLVNFVLNYSELDTKSKQIGYKHNKPLPNRPENSVYARCQLNLKKFTYWIDGNKVGKNYFDDGGYYYYNSYTILNTGLIYSLNRHLKLSFTIKNFTNNQNMFAYVNGYDVAKTPYYPLEGRSFYISLNYRY